MERRQTTYIYYRQCISAYIGFDHRRNEEDVYTTCRAITCSCSRQHMQQGPGRGGQENHGCSDHQVWLGPQPQASDRSMGQLMKLQARTGHPQHL